MGRRGRRRSQEEVRESPDGIPGNGVRESPTAVPGRAWQTPAAIPGEPDIIASGDRNLMWGRLLGQSHTLIHDYFCMLYNDVISYGNNLILTELPE